MAKYLYNGIPLLDINTVWTDKTTYPYAILVVNAIETILHISPVPFIYNNPTVSIDGVAGSPKYRYDSSGWVEDGTGSGYTGSGVKWTNYDIIDTSDNSVYLAASEPVLVEDPVPDNVNFDLKSFLIGFALGRAGKTLPPAQKEPVAYLYGTPSESGNIGLRVGDTVTYYNGAVLPALPEWDKTVYPYAVIVDYGYSILDKENRAFLYLLKDQGDRYLQESQIDSEYIYYHAGDMYYKATSPKDEPYTEWTESDILTEAKMFNLVGIIWTKEPIYYQYDNHWGASGELALAASDPIPVGEIVEYIDGIPIYEVI